MKFKHLLDKYESAKAEIFEYFGIKEDHQAQLHIDTSYIDMYWFVYDNCLYWADNKADFESGDYYCTDVTVDDSVYNTWEADGYAAVQIGCGEHQDASLLILKLDKKLSCAEVWGDEEEAE